jgi:hypothetical protein
MRFLWFPAMRGMSAGDAAYYGHRWYLQCGPLLIFIGTHPGAPRPF